MIVLSCIHTERTKKRVNGFLQDGASAGMWSLQTSIVIKLPNNMEWTLTFYKKKAEVEISGS